MIFFSHTLLNMTKAISFPNLQRASAMKIRAISLRDTNIDTCAKCVSCYDVCNPTLPGSNVLSMRFDIGLTIVNNTSYTEQIYIYIEVHAICW